jgi:hypothetical protein
MQPSQLDGVSIRDMLDECFNTQTLNTRQSIVCDVFPSRVAKVINMPMGQFGIVLTASNTSHLHVPIIWQRACIHWVIGKWSFQRKSTNFVMDKIIMPHST